ncbi:MAG: hypothetical protein ABI833_05035 [Acidobacteriota bacterium]
MRLHILVWIALAGAGIGAAQNPAKKPATKAWTPPRTPDGQPDLQGIWNSATGTPVERPDELKGKEFFTPQEARDWEKTMQARSKKDGKPGDPGVVGTYNDAFWEIGTKPSKTLRTSIVIDPSDGKMPKLTPAAAAARQAKIDRIYHPDGADDLGLGDQCLMFSTGTPPMLPYTYNSNYRIVQTRDYVAIYVEMIHDTRIIPLDGRKHLPSSVRLWYGDSIGHWEGDTLVVDTTNFIDKSNFYFQLPYQVTTGPFADVNMHVVERFRRMDADTILYQFDVDDPTAYAKPWKGEYTMSASPGPIYEYACHEGNYGLPDVLRGARAEEKAAAAKARK